MKDFRYKHHLSYPEDGDPIIGKIIELTNLRKVQAVLDALGYKLVVRKGDL